MVGSNIQQNLIPNQASVKDLLDLFRKDLLLDFNCHHIGTVQSFDATQQTASATINYKKTLFQFNSVTGGYVPVLVDFPQLIDCPVIVLGGGSGALTFPIGPGDECLVFFNDRDIDNWFAGATGGAVATPRLHSFSDGLIVVGLRSMANVIEDYDEDRTVLRQGDNARVAVSDEDANLEYGEDVIVYANEAEAALAFGGDSKVFADTDQAALVHGESSAVADDDQAALVHGTASVVADDDGATIKNGLVKVAAHSTAIAFTNGTFTLKTLLQNLTSQLQSLTTQITLLTVTVGSPGPSSVPINAAAFTTIGSNIATIATNLGSLLE